MLRSGSGGLQTCVQYSHALGYSTANPLHGWESSAEQAHNHLRYFAQPLVSAVALEVAKFCDGHMGREGMLVVISQPLRLKMLSCCCCYRLQCIGFLPRLRLHKHHLQEKALLAGMATTPAVMKQ